MKKTWFYLSNSFLRATVNSFRKMLGLVSYHLSALEAENSDPEIMALYNTSNTDFSLYISKYAAWNAAKADLAGETKQFNNYLDEMSDRLADWDIAIQQVYKEKTSDYKRIFSKGKTIFYTGTQEERISELSTLELQLAKYPALADVLTAVQTYNTLLKTSKNNKEKSLEKLDKASQDLEKSRVVAGNLMYRNLGMLVFKYFETPTVIDRFFDLELLRRHLTNKDDEENQSYVVKIDPAATEEAGISFEENAKFSLYNNSNATVGVYAAAENPATAPTQMMILEPEDEKNTSLAELNGQNCRFLFFVNQDEHEEAEIEIVLMEE